MFACFKRNLTKELKVAQLAGSVAEISAYHHGEQSLMGTIIGLAQVRPENGPEFKWFSFENPWCTGV